MNIYLCSTVRNLLFSLLKSLSEPEQKSCILMICDQQNIDASYYNTADLPTYIKIKFISRKSIHQTLDRKLLGRIFRVLATLNITTSKKIRDFIYHQLFNVILEKQELISTNKSNLFLFNDRNRLARLFRLVFKNYTLIEDGLLNYYGSKLKLHEAIWRTITQHTFNKRYLGDDSRCTAIYLLKPSSAPEGLKPKARLIKFINHENITGVCYSFFRFKGASNLNNNFNWILATQPISIDKLTETNFDIVIYNKILDYINKKDLKIALKIHPRESSERYTTAFPNQELLKSKIPLELIILGAKKRCNIISIYSSAGMGFEQYCNRITLIKDQESEFMQDIFTSWKNNIKLLDDRINFQLCKENI